jgi:hypothetical protein
MTRKNQSKTSSLVNGLAANVSGATPGKIERSCGVRFKAVESGDTAQLACRLLGSKPTAGQHPLRNLGSRNARRFV